MPKVTAYKCPHTGKLFEEVREYKNYLRRLSRIRNMERKELERQEMLESRMTEFRNSIKSINQLPQMIIDHQDLFWETASNERGWRGNDFDICRKTGIWPKLVEFTEFSLHFSEQVSNSHRCPVGGVTNWGGRVEGAPRGYPGWSGRICWVVEWPHKYGGQYPGGALFENSRINTGTGGGGGSLIRQNVECQSFGYGIEIFGTDWEVMYAEYRKTCFINDLKGKHRHVR